ncbi:hypothetical protein RBU55_07615 [Pseudomonas chlororaphis subsp. aurantiaca]|uniref:hypothetical protein n=1 Tax=Pseudomonas chlororaphis TaxID=587753 RepID=UPI0027DB7E27|nr:hypothetical protein [Pseudomonas chlororaphis]WMJ01411.1 hypothetical protein RBU55_07615 [Pseudomonas chlororaphis subsp. aurantiaca]
MPIYMSPQRAQQTNSTQRAGESLPIADASSNIASHLSLIKNTSEAASNVAIERERSADIIKRFLQKSIAAQSYGEMFSNGSYFKKTGNDLPKQEGRFSFSTLDHLNKISSENLVNITKKLSPLTPSERELLSKVMSTKIHFRHQSNADLGGRDIKYFL